jgi:hypothetical protein
MNDTSTIILVEEKNNLIKNGNDTIHQDFTMETLNWEKQNIFERSSLFFSYSIIIKCYMSNLGPHLRHNRHHTLLHMKEKPCSEFDLHMHDQQPTLTHALTYKSAFYDYLTIDIL